MPGVSWISQELSCDILPKAKWQTFVLRIELTETNAKINRKDDIRENRGFILAVLSFGHGVAHWFSESLPLMLPYIQATMGFSTLQYGILGAASGVTSGVVNIPGGILADRLKRFWGLILCVCMVWVAISYAILGIAPSYPAMFIAVAILGVPGTIWHLPATAALSQRFPDKRGFAVSMHGVGSNAGNFVGPVLTGALLGVMFWRSVAFVYIAPALLVALMLWLTIMNIGVESPDDKSRTLREWFQNAMKMFKNPAVIGLVAVSLFRSGALSTMTLWTPKYLGASVAEGGLEMSSFKVGLYFGFLAGMGFLSGPVLGLISDKYGRKFVLVPGLIISALLPVLIVHVGSGIVLAIILIAAGLFTWSLHQIVLAAVLDVVGRGTEATAVGLVFAVVNMVGGISPLIAAFIINHWSLGAIFYYVALLTGASAILMILVPLKRYVPSTPRV